MKFTIISNTQDVLSKKMSSDGIKSSHAILIDGTYETIEVENLYEFNNILDKLEFNMAITLGITDATTGLITTREYLASRKEQNKNINVASRSKEHFRLENESILFFDIDFNDLTTTKITSYEQILNIIEEIDEQFIDAEILIRHSSSSNIYKYHKHEKIKIYGTGSYHVYFVARNANTNLDKYVKQLEDRAFELGYGYFKVSKTGSLLKRQVFDSSVFSPERLIFESGMICDYPYEQEKVEAFYRKGTYIDCAKLPQVNSFILHSNIASEQQKVNQESQNLKHAYRTETIKKLIASGFTEDDAINKVDVMMSENILCSNHDIQLSNGKMIKVRDIFLNPMNYNNLSCHDPIEPEKGNAKAIIFSNKGESPIIKSFIHGGIYYKLDIDYETVKAIASNAVYDSENNEILVERIKILSKKANLNTINRSNIGKILKVKKIVSSIDTFQATKEEIIEQAKSKGYLDFIKNGNIAPTIENLIVLMKNYEIDYSYDVIKKIPTIEHPSIKNNAPNMEDAIVSMLERFAFKENIDISIVKHIPSVANRVYTNPLIIHIKEAHKLYLDLNEEIDYIDQVAKTLSSSASSNYVKAVLKIWFIQCIAAWDYDRNYTRKDAKEKFESVLVLQGNQGVQKTKFFSSLLAKSYQHYIKTGAMLNPSDKDSLIENTRYAICELGELDSTFNKSDIGALKAFLSNSVDEYRVPYGKVASKHKRSTSYCASVNERGFLRDSTGARRFLIVPVEGINFEAFEAIDKDMLWAQAYNLYLVGNKWWLDATDVDINSEMSELHNFHRANSPADEVFIAISTNSNDSVWLSITKIFQTYNIERFTRRDIGDLSNLLYANGYESNKRKEYYVPEFKHFDSSSGYQVTLNCA